MVDALNIATFKQKLLCGELDIVEHTEMILQEAEKLNPEYHYFNVISKDLARMQAKELQREIQTSLKLKDKKKLQQLQQKKLLGVPISVKDAICVKGVESTAGSRILKGYLPPFNATVISRSINEGGIIIGKTSQDEFGFGGFNVNVGLDYQVPKNPFDKNRTTGGSSGGGSGFVQLTKYTHASLTESTGGSIVEPAAFCGVVGLCPTYGRVSRYGLMDFANSLDKIGATGKATADVAVLLQSIAGFDQRNATTTDIPVEDYPSFVGKPIKGLKIGVLSVAFGEGTDSFVAERVWKGIKALESEGASYEEVNLELPITMGVPTYYLIATSEASTNLAKYCGLRYGKHEPLEGSFNEYFTLVRSKNLGEEAKRRIMLGTFARMAGYRDACYLKALKVRTKMIEEYKKLFTKYDVLMTPTAPIIAPKFDEIAKLTPLQHYMIDIFTVGPNIAGLPHISVPVGKQNGMPVGALAIADHFKESTLIKLGSVLEKTCGAGKCGCE